MIKKVFNSIYLSAYLLFAIIIALGILLCFWGYKLLRILIGALSLFVGFYAAHNFLTTSQWITTPLSDSTILVFSIIAALILCVLCFFIYKVGLFFFGAYIGFSIASAILSFLTPELSYLTLLIIKAIAGLLFGFVVLTMRKPLLIILTSFCGSLIMCTFMGYLVFFKFQLTTLNFNFLDFSPIGAFMEQNIWWLIVSTTIFGLIGLLAQSKLTGSKQIGVKS